MSSQNRILDLVCRRWAGSGLCDGAAHVTCASWLARFSQHSGRGGADAGRSAPGGGGGVIPSTPNPPNIVIATIRTSVRFGHMKRRSPRNEESQMRNKLVALFSLTALVLGGVFIVSPKATTVANEAVFGVDISA